MKSSQSTRKQSGGPFGEYGEVTFQTKNTPSKSTDFCTLLELGGNDEVVVLKVPPSPDGSTFLIPVSIVLRCDKCAALAQPTQQQAEKNDLTAARFQIVRSSPDWHRRVVHWSRELTVDSNAAALLHEKAELETGSTYHLVLTRQPEPFPITLVVRSSSAAFVVDLLPLAPIKAYELKKQLWRIYEAEILRSGETLGSGEYRLDGDGEEGEGQQDQGETEAVLPVCRKELCFDWGIGVALCNNSENVEVTETSELDIANIDLLAAERVASSLRREEDGVVRVTLKAAPGEVSSFVLISSRLGEGFRCERSTLTHLKDLDANKPSALEALRCEAMAKGEEHCYPESPGIARFAHDFPSGSALAYFNDAATSVKLVEEVVFDAQHMDMWTLLPDGSVQALDSTDPVTITLEPGESQMVVLRATEVGEAKGYSFGFEYSYSVESLV